MHFQNTSRCTLPTEALEILGAFFVAWSSVPSGATALQQNDHDALDSLMVEYQLDRDTKATLDRFLRERLTENELRQFLRGSGNEARNVFRAGLEFAYGTVRSLGRREKNALYTLAELSGIDAVDGIRLVAKFTSN